MAGVDLKIPLKCGQAFQRVHQGFYVSAAQVGPATAAAEQGVTGKQRVFAFQRDGTGGGRAFRAR
jgi:hypothetical protein